MSKMFDIDERTWEEDGYTPLIISCIMDHLEMVVLLVEDGASLDLGDKARGYTALIYAAANRSVEVVEYLLEKGACLEVKDNEGHAVLCHTASLGFCDMTKILLKRGAIVDAGSEVMTALHGAAYYGHVGTVEILVSAGAKLDLQNIDGCVPLDLASKKGHYDVVKWMLTNTGISSCGGATQGVVALHLASSKGQIEVMQLLMEFKVYSVLELCAAFRGALDNLQVNSVKFLLEVRFRTFSDIVTCALKTTVKGYKYGCSSSRMTRLLMDAGARPTKELYYEEDGVSKSKTALEIVVELMGKESEVEHLQRLNAIHRLLQQEHAVNSSSLLWPFSSKSSKSSKSSCVSLVRLMRKSKGVRGRVLICSFSRYVRKTG